jgi:hypothetical protein
MTLVDFETCFDFSLIFSVEGFWSKEDITSEGLGFISSVIS